MKKIINYLRKNRQIIKVILFLFWIVLHIFFMIHHEPWRDEARAWLLAKNLNIINLFITSRFDGHPILWHLILMPFAKNGFPYITLQIINLIICSVAAYIFYFKIKINDIFKTLILFGTPFTFVYIIIARNYSLILLFITLIAYLYPKRYKCPYIYTLILCLILNTPTISYGFAISTYFLFNFCELIKYFKNKNILSLKQIIITNIMFLFTLSFIILELSGTSNPDYPKPFSTNNSILYNYPFFIEIIFSIIIFGIIARKSNVKTYIICIISLVYQLLITAFFYPSIFEIRALYQCIIWLFFIITSNKKDIKINKLLMIVFLIFYFPKTILCYSLALKDVKSNYSGAKETAIWINKNIKQKQILIEDSVFCQSIEPYLNQKKLFDIYYEKNLSALKTYSDNKKDKKINTSQYKQKYIIIYNTKRKNWTNSKFKLVFSSKKSLTGEDFTVYYIK